MKLLKTVLSYGLPLVFAALLVWYTFKGVDIEQMWLSIADANYFYIVLSALPMTVAHWSRGRRWQLLLQPLGHKLTTFDAFLAVMSGYFGNLIVPRMGEVTRCAVLQKRNNIPLNESVGTVVVERVFDIVMLLFITALAFVFEFSKLTTFFTDKLAQKQALSNAQPQTENNGLLLGLGIGLIVVLIFGFVAFKYRQKLMNYKFVPKIRQFLLGLWDGILSIKKLERPKEFIFHTVLIWAGYFFTLYLSMFALGATASLGILAAFTILVVGSFGMVAPVQGGLGAYHWIVTMGLVELYQVEKIPAAGAATLFHTSQTIYTFLIGALCSLWVLVDKSKIKG
jgi:uncharacterized membrane protein YbhN (UPF0104 family)